MRAAGRGTNANQTGMGPKAGLAPKPLRPMRKLFGLVAVAGALAAGCGAGDSPPTGTGASPGPVNSCDPVNDTCVAGSPCSFDCRAPPGFHCVPGPTGPVTPGGSCSDSDRCQAGSECFYHSLPDGGVAPTGTCTAYCADSRQCSAGGSCRTVQFNCRPSGTFDVGLCI
jgi:hypothetical protein